MNETGETFKAGDVAIVGRPNVGKSTLLNAIVEQKIAITSPKPQTTRSQIAAYYEDPRGQIFFLDTPGLYEGGGGGTQFNAMIQNTIDEADVVVFVVDKTRDWGNEDERVWRMLELANKPVILIINKMDVNEPDYTENYLALLEPEVEAVMQTSALNNTHIKGLIETIYDYLPEGERDATVDHFPTPLISMSGKEYLAELIREKVYMTTGQEVPYMVSTRVTEVEETDERMTVRGKLLVPKSRYKGMLIGKNGRKIREIRMMVEKELKVITQKDVRVKLKVEVE